jgi:hypothetical protein
VTEGNSIARLMICTPYVYYLTYLCKKMGNAGHVAGIGTNINAQRVLVGKYENSRQF